VTPEQQYVKCMDAAYAAADKATCHRMMRRAENALRRELGPKKSADGPSDEALAA